MLDPIIIDELKLLERINERLRSLPPSKEASEAPIVRELQRLRSVLLSGEEAKDRSSLTEQYHNQASLLRQLRDAKGANQVDPVSPYFAHLRLREDEREWDLCLGRATCIEKGIRIVDWRDAPISKIFYSYRQGEDYDEEIAGRERAGEVVVRRMVRIENAELQRIQAPEGDFRYDPHSSEGWRREESRAPRLAGGEEAALRAHPQGDGAARRLGSGRDGELLPADKHLPEITGLIDPTQFELITRPKAGFLVIRGVAGSGKTTVALHRVAYLAYDDRQVDGPQTLVLVFSTALRNYVGHVLPSLGLSHVSILTYREWVSEIRKRHFQRLPKADRDDAPALVQRLKLHPIMGVALERQVARVEGSSDWEQALDDWASVLTQAQLLKDCCADCSPGAFSESEIDRFVQLGRQQVDDLYAYLGGDKDVQAELNPEDDVLLLRAWQLRVGPLRGQGKQALHYRHVVLDEVQDFSPLEVRLLLGCLDARPSITLAGDTQQHISQNSGFRSWSHFFEHLGVEGSEIETLRVSYRSSREIVSFAFDVLGELREDDELPDVTRDGPPVEFFCFADAGACLAFLADALRELADAEPLASVAILAPTPQLSDQYFDALSRSELPRLRRVRNQEFTFASGIEVTEVEQVKGLEFDYVILVEASAVHYPDNAPSRRLLHVGATRAVHQLWLTCVGSPSPLISNGPVHNDTVA